MPKGGSRSQALLISVQELNCANRDKIDTLNTSRPPQGKTDPPPGHLHFTEEHQLDQKLTGVPARESRVYLRSGRTFEIGVIPIISECILFSARDDRLNGTHSLMRYPSQMCATVRSTLRTGGPSTVVKEIVTRSIPFK